MKRAIVVALLLALAVVGQLWLRTRRPESAPALAEGALAAFGGFRSIAAEVVWFRADRLQEEGRYVELAQLATALTLMEPHTPEVWSYAAWNLAYNVSVMMDSSEERWQWVYSAVKLLRDQGIVLNPREPELYRELAWLFELKIGTDIDAAGKVYREKWAEIVRDVKERGAWEELGMDVKRMLAIEQATSLNDWENPLLSAIYFASAGAQYADGRELSLLKEIARQSAIIYSKNRK